MSSAGHTSHISHVSPTTGKVRGPSIVISDPAKPPRSAKRRSAYVRGQYAAILPVRDHLEPAELTGCAIELDATRSVLTITEQGTRRAPKHRLNGEPYYLDIAMADGSEVQIEIRRFGVQPVIVSELDDLNDAEPSQADLLLIGVRSSHHG